MIHAIKSIKLRSKIYDMLTEYKEKNNLATYSDAIYLLIIQNEACKNKVANNENSKLQTL